MKQFTIVAVFLFALNLDAQNLQRLGLVVGKSPEQEAENEAREAARKKQEAHDFIPRDPWRAIGGITNYAKGTNWFHFWGKVWSVDIENDLVAVSGHALAPAEDGWRMDEVNFIVRNFPRKLASQEIIPRESDYCARIGGVDRETGLRIYDYGKVCAAPMVPQPSAEQIAVAKAKADKAKADQASALLKFQQESAKKGEAYGQYKMAMRYLAGDGVEKNEQTARELLTAASAQGNKDAAAALAKLPSK